MKRALFVAALLSLAAPAFAAEVYLGTITGSSSTNNSTTSSAFDIGANNRIVVQCDVAAYLGLGSTTSTAVTSSNGLQVDAGEKWETVTGSSAVYLAVLPVSGTANCKVFRVQ